MFTVVGLKPLCWEEVFAAGIGGAWLPIDIEPGHLLWTPKNMFPTLSCSLQELATVVVTIAI